MLYRAKERVEVFGISMKPVAFTGSAAYCLGTGRKRHEATVICDNTAASLFKIIRLTRLFRGNRIALNGDTANKIGTYNLAILSIVSQYSFYIAALIYF